MSIEHPIVTGAIDIFQYSLHLVYVTNFWFSLISSVALRKKPAGKDTEPPPCVIYPKGGKGNARSKPGKDMVSRPKRKGTGVGYAKGRY